MNIIITGPTELLIEGLFGPRQADEHLKSWRWFRYIEEYNLKEREANVSASARDIITRANARRRSLG